MQGPRAQAAALDWYRRRTIRNGCDSIEEIAALRSASGLRVTICLPALNEQATIGPICDRLRASFIETGIGEELLVIDSGSSDDTVTRAVDAGATVHRVADILPETPAITGKGEALWRSLAVATGDVCVYLDSDVENLDETFVTRLLEPLLSDPGVSFVKAFYERPLGSDRDLGGGRVTELVARPLLNLFFPELTGFVQPLAGEYAARTDILRGVPFFCGYAVEIGLLIDLADRAGLESMIQVDLGRRVHRNRETSALGPMAFEITKAILERAESAGRVKLEGDPTEHFVMRGDDALRSVAVPLKERPPMNNYPGAGSSGGDGPGSTGVGL